ncbi:hypothetical protein D1007_43366 [Hordeum vulgare]|nr:hypothetical protein D1007_43366 [Hordeum vulgare]
MDQLHYEQPMNGANAMVILPSSSFLDRGTSKIHNKVQVDVSEPILTLEDKFSDEYSETVLEFPFECKEVYSNSHGYETRHVNPKSELSYPVSSPPIACDSLKLRLSRYVINIGKETFTMSSFAILGSAKSVSSFQECGQQSSSSPFSYQQGWYKNPYYGD